MDQHFRYLRKFARPGEYWISATFNRPKKMDVSEADQEVERILNESGFIWRHGYTWPDDLDIFKWVRSIPPHDGEIQEFITKTLQDLLKGSPIIVRTQRPQVLITDDDPKDYCPECGTRDPFRPYGVCNGCKLRQLLKKERQTNK